MQYLYISYPENDYPFAHRLVDDLQAAGYTVFVDAVSDVGTVAWAAETRHAIRSCGAVLMVLSPAEGRRTGIRHEGILAHRRKRPTFALLRSPGDVPRYLQQAVQVDFSGDYGPALAQLCAVLPAPASLLAAPDPMPQRRPRRPPHPPNRFRRRMVWVVTLTTLALVCLALLGIAFGVVSL
jgi:hypothetical protein